VLNDKWTLEKLIGLGGMAAVYAAVHRNGARGAVKLLHSELARVAEVRERFTREGYAANKVNHPGSVRVLDDDVVKSGPDAGSAYLIMELLEGRNLEDRIHDGGPFTHEEILQIADDVLDVLAAAHAQGVIHRDLKPENLMLEAGEGPFGFTRVKVLDFGLARLAHQETVTRAGMALGTPSYMAPEQAQGRSEDIDGRSDVFAVGAILFRLLTGRRVHEGTNVIEVVAKMAKDPAPAIRTVRADIPADIAAIIDRALQFKSKDRYPGAAEMRDDIRAARVRRRPARKAASASIGTEPTQIAATPLGALSPQPTMPEPVREKPRSIGVMISIVWVAAVMIAGIVVFALLRRGRVEQMMPATPTTESALAAEPAPSAAASDASPASSVEDLQPADAGAAAKPTASVKPKPTATSTKKAPVPTVKKKK
jgi:serine/threonine protein kinase